MFPLAAAALFRRPLDLEGVRLEQATVFPLFDEGGKVYKLLLVVEEPALVALVDWRPGLVSKPFFGPVRLDVRLGSLDDLTAREANEAAGWWHFDPWWLLTEPHLCKHPSAAPLRTTNCVDELEKVVSLNFARDLSKVTTITRSPGEGVQVLPFEPGLLARRTVEAVATNRRTAWRLRPFWQRPAS
ncbi:MAG: hypothetical protein KC910_34895 [Candidatus Eremiobacteraeota bacterium]|nr:hypothetical protein [Candidatus Eremiobacteraeota bacterium]